MWRQFKLSQYVPKEKELSLMVPYNLNSKDAVYHCGLKEKIRIKGSVMWKRRTKKNAPLSVRLLI